METQGAEPSLTNTRGWKKKPSQLQQEDRQPTVATSFSHLHSETEILGLCLRGNRWRGSWWGLRQQRSYMCLVPVHILLMSSQSQGEERRGERFLFTHKPVSAAASWSLCTCTSLTHQTGKYPCVVVVSELITITTSQRHCAKHLGSSCLQFSDRSWPKAVFFFERERNESTFAWELQI